MSNSEKTYFLAEPLLFYNTWLISGEKKGDSMLMMTKAEMNRLYAKMDRDAQRAFAAPLKLSKRRRREVRILWAKIRQIRAARAEQPTG